MDRALVLALGFFTIECNSEAIAREVRRPPSHQRRQLRCQLQEEDHSNRGQFGIVARARGPTSLFWSSSLSGVGGSVSGPPFPLGLASEGREDVTCRRCNVTDGCRESMSKRDTFERRTGGGGAVPKCQWQDGMRAAGSALGRRKRRPLRTDTPRGGGSSYDSSSSDSSRSSSSSSRAAGKAGVPSVVLRLRGGDAPPSSSSPSKTKVDIKEEAPWSINLNVFGWGGENTEAKAEEKKKAQQIIEHAQARDVMRKAREERLERELEESGAGEEGEEVGEDKTAGGILVSMAKAGEPARQAASQGDKRLWLDAVEGFLGGVSLVTTSLYPLWHTLRGMFGLSLLFYGQDFATLAFHIVVFRISGWKKAAKSKDDLVAYYKKARSTMSKAAKDVRASAAIIARQNKLVARKEEMMKEKKRLHAMGRVSAEEARAFIDKYRQEIDIIAQEQEILSETSSSVLAIKGALSFKKLAASVNSLYAAVITSITASTFKRAGQLTLALTCGGLIKRTLFDLLGPIIDPIGYQIELETYVANIMRGPANLYITLAGYMSSASVFFHFFVDPHQALTITFVLLGARVVTDYIVAALNPVRWRFGIQKKLDNMPLSAMIYLVLASLGFMFHGNAGIVGDYACKPFIAFLGVLNEWLNHFQATTISYFS